MSHADAPLARYRVMGSDPLFPEPAELGVLTVDADCRLAAQISDAPASHVLLTAVSLINGQECLWRPPTAQEAAGVADPGTMLLPVERGAGDFLRVLESTLQRQFGLQLQRL